MPRTSCRSAIFLLALALAAGGAWAEVPRTLGYQGRLLTSDGTPAAGTLPVTFSLFSTETGGTAAWTETQQLAFSDGFYATHLGAVTPLPEDLFTSGDRFLEVKVGAETLTPRQRVSAVAYAFEARNVRGGVVDATEIRVNGQTVITRGGQLAPSAEYRAGAGISIDANRTIGLAAQCAPGQVLEWSGSAWACGADDNSGVAFTAGAGLTLSGGSLSVNPVAVQARIEATCPAGSAIRAVDATGAVTCQVDANTSYSAGAGLELNGTSFALKTGCSAGQLLKWSGSTWACADDVDTTNTYSAGGGLALSGSSFSVDTGVIQARVGGTCPVGSSIRAVAADGAVTCQGDTNTTYTAGAGLSLAGTTFAADPAVVQARISASCPPGSAIRAVDATGAVTCDAALPAGARLHVVEAVVDGGLSLTFQTDAGAPLVAQGWYQGSDLGWYQYASDSVTTEPCGDCGDGRDGVLNVTSGAALAPGEYWFEQITVAAGATLGLSASGTLILHSKRDVVINGSISVDGKGFGGGAPGYLYECSPGAFCLTLAQAGSGPEGGAAGAGYDGASGSHATHSNGDQALAGGLEVGSGGGGGAGQNTGKCSGAAGGNGGGAVKLMAPSITVGPSGSIAARGLGGGGVGTCTNLGPRAGAGGGGAGGSVWLRARLVQINGSVLVTGGAHGANGASFAASGRTRIDAKSLSLTGTLSPGAYQGAVSGLGLPRQILLDTSATGLVRLTNGGVDSARLRLVVIQ